jgi:hypothetical protein
MYNFHPPLNLALSLFAMLIATGCGDGRPSRVPISGQVLIDGKPLRLGSIRFYPEVGRASTGRMDEQGRFKLSCYENGDGALVGRHAVSISASEEVGDLKVRWHIPKKYARPETSGLECIVEKPSDAVRFELSWDGGAPFIELVK